MEKSTGKANTIHLSTNITEHSMIISSTPSDSCSTRAVISTREISRRAKKTVRVRTPTQTGHTMKGSTRMIRGMVRGDISLMTTPTGKVSGCTVREKGSVL